MASEREKEIAREKFAIATTFLLLVPLILMGFFFIVLGLKLKVLDRQAVIMVDAVMTFGYIILWFIVKGLLLKYFRSAKKAPARKKGRTAKPEKKPAKKEGKLSRLVGRFFKKKKKEEKRGRWKA